MSEGRGTQKKRRFRVPHVYTIIFALTVLTALASLVIPSGAYERGEGGRVDGFISADAVHIAGTVTGRIEAITVTIAKSATVIGAIIHNSLEIEKGATLDGPRPWRPMSFMAELRPV